MKMIKIFGLLLFAMFAFNACGDDDDDEVAIDLNGTSWETTYVKYYVSGYNDDYKDFETEEKLRTYYYYQILNFKADGIFELENTDGDIETGTWSQDGSKFTITIGDNVSTGTVSGSKIKATTTETTGTDGSNITIITEYEYEQVEEELKS